MEQISTGLITGDSVMDWLDLTPGPDLEPLQISGLSTCGPDQRYVGCLPPAQDIVCAGADEACTACVRNYMGYGDITFQTNCQYHTRPL